MDDITEDLKRFNIPLRGVRIRRDPSPEKKVSNKAAKVTKSVKKTDKAQTTKQKLVARVDTTDTTAISIPDIKNNVGINNNVGITNNVGSVDHQKQQPDQQKQQPKQRRKVKTPTDNTPRTDMPTIEEIAAKVLPPMQVVRTEGGIVENIDSGMYVKCPRGHAHHYLLAEILSRTPVCKTCSLPGAITRRIREQIEDIFSIPFYLEKREKTYTHYVATLNNVKIHLFTVKSGQEVAQIPDSICIILPESQSKTLVNESIYKQCLGKPLPQEIQRRIDALAPKTVAKKDERLPYSTDFAEDSLNYKIIRGDNLYIENCGWKL